ncbi:MAG: FAD:protein FMN transferase [Candidatus Paceibacterota bacterium]|jgi:thiamine biosynthesis lipoprotein
MGMPIEVTIVGSDASAALEAAFAYIASIDARFSTYKEDSEISRINRGEVEPDEISGEMREVFALAEKTKKETGGYFDIRRPDGLIDPSGIVKGWAIRNTAALVCAAGFENFFVNAGGDIAMGGSASWRTPAGGEKGEEWSIGIRNPFNVNEIVKVVYPRGRGVATSGSYVRGDHVYNPHAPEETLRDIVSITIIGPDVLEADRFATAAFAMGRDGIFFIEQLPDFEGYAIDATGIATMTSGFAAYTAP